MLERAPDNTGHTSALMTRQLVVNGPKARGLRKKAKLTQEGAAVQVGLAASSLRRIEGGAHSVQLTTLGKLALLYNVQPEELLTWTP
jgi:transcriptional regulator with XRE-family HTH domain